MKKLSSNKTTSSCSYCKSSSTGTGYGYSTLYFNKAGWIITMQFAIAYLSMHVFVYRDWSGGAPKGFIKLLRLKWYMNCGKCFIVWGNLKEVGSILW
jgi:hypothetical protein